MKHALLLLVPVFVALAGQAQAMSLCGKEGDNCIIPGGTKEILIGHGTDAANGVPARYVGMEPPGKGTKEFTCNRDDFGWTDDGYSGELECYTSKGK